MRTGRVLILLALGCGLSSAASFDAAVIVDLIFPVPFPPTIIPALAPGIGAGCFSTTSGFASVTSCPPPTSLFAPNTLTYTAGAVIGSSGPGIGSAFANSFGPSDMLSLTNIGVDPADFFFSVAWTWSLTATAGPLESASAGYDFLVFRGGGGSFAPFFGSSLTINCVECGTNSSLVAPPPVVFFISIPPGQTVQFYVDGFAQGDAHTLPEPSTFLLLGAGILAGVGWWRRRPLAR
ncbi:MAG: PEP-CTERM sorting domain-containing protein [Acidobacteria bacterium]|nr:PEP-CTERM sorting domain-containing protein [Acidobacteriota bacterium]